MTKPCGHEEWEFCGLSCFGIIRSDDKMELKELGELRLIVRQVEDDIYSVEFIGQTTRSHKYILKDSFHKMLDIFREEGAEHYKSKEEKIEEIYEVDGIKFKRIMSGDFFVRIE